MNKKKNTEELLSEVYKNVTMGSENLGNMVPMIKDRFMMTNVTCQMEKYSSFTRQADSLLKRQAVKPEKLSPMKKAMARAGASLNTLFDSSDGHIADMIVKGTKMGADSLERTLCRIEEQGAEEDAVALARAVVAFEREESEKMKDFGH
ncbi:MAG: hypothetical protein E7638_00550 [Ruminococcaceae bacterium]|nr:hypothetical protein [Oscillospiraceae bacterium]